MNGETRGGESSTRAGDPSASAQLNVFLENVSSSMQATRTFTFRREVLNNDPIVEDYMVRKNQIMADVFGLVDMPALTAGVTHVTITREGQQGTTTREYAIERFKSMPAGTFFDTTVFPYAEFNLVRKEAMGDSM